MHTCKELVDGSFGKIFFAKETEFEDRRHGAKGLGSLF
jgi:hypothetical protein